MYLYGEAAREESRRTLPAIRAGEYEALPQKVSLALWEGRRGPCSSQTLVPGVGGASFLGQLLAPAEVCESRAQVAGHGHRLCFVHTPGYEVHPSVTEKSMG